MASVTRVYIEALIQGYAQKTCVQSKSNQYVLRETETPEMSQHFTKKCANWNYNQ